MPFTSEPDQAVSSFVLTCFTVVVPSLFVLAVLHHPQFLLGAFIQKVGHQNGFQQTEQHQRKDHDTVGSCKEERGHHNLDSGTIWTGGKVPSQLRCTYERGLVGHGGQDVIQDEQQHGDGQQHGDLEAQLLSSVVSDEEGGQVQSQEEDNGQQEVDDIEEGPPLHGELRKKVYSTFE